MAIIHDFFRLVKTNVLLGRQQQGDIRVTDARQATQRQPEFLTLLGIGLSFRVYNGGLDRLWTAHLLGNFTIPGGGRSRAGVWLDVIQAISVMARLTTTEIARRLEHPPHHEQQAQDSQRDTDNRAHDRQADDKADDHQSQAQNDAHNSPCQL